jgi:hypothetical protein
MDDFAMNRTTNTSGDEANGKNEAMPSFKPMRRFSIHADEEVDVVVRRMRYGGGTLDVHNCLKQPRRHSKFVCLKCVERAKRTFAWEKPDWVHRRRYVEISIAP